MSISKITLKDLGFAFSFSEDCQTCGNGVILMVTTTWFTCHLIPLVVPILQQLQTCLKLSLMSLWF